ncbi:MAG: Z1 domain-containing protein [Solirubrobacterales bacterium]|nr:Z1 domain-containing protein [Solirubrobacterales bacterium]
MLVHVTRFVDVQSQVAKQVQAEVDELAERLAGYGGTRDQEEMLQEFQELWADDFLATSVAMSEDTPEDSWDAVADGLSSVTAKLKVMEINGSQRDVLTYLDSDAVSVIAIGGDKLSRGLTLEGLSVSYYLRASKMYDTLMQMGRWFGFRPGYLDLTRLYTSPEIQAAFRQVSIANEELKEKFDEMSRTGSNPRDFALYVRKSDNLFITAPGKMRDSMRLEIGFAGKIVETIGFSSDVQTQRKNLDTLKVFATGLERNIVESHPSNHLILGEVAGDSVASMFELFTTIDSATKARSRQLSEYIRDQLRRDELHIWTVAFIHNSTAPPRKRIHILGSDIGFTHRTNMVSDSDQDAASESIEGRYAIKRLIDPVHEYLDLSPQEKMAVEQTRDLAWAKEVESARARGVDTTKMRKLSLGPFVRKYRPPERALLMIYLLDAEGTGMDDDLDVIPGFAVSFPDSETAESVKYAVPRRYKDLINE